MIIFSMSLAEDGDGNVSKAILNTNYTTKISNKADFVAVLLSKET